MVSEILQFNLLQRSLCFICIPPTESAVLKMSLGLSISLMFLSALPSCCQPFLTWVKWAIMKREHWVKNTVSKVESNAGQKKGTKIFSVQLFQGLFSWNPSVLLQCLLHFYRQKGYLLCECHSIGRMKSFCYRAGCDLRSRLRGGIFAPMTSKLPLGY